MDQATIRQTFRRTYNGHPNIMTPEKIRYGKRGRYLYELSRGDGFPGSGSPHMYGVTVLTLAGERTDLSEGGFPTLEAAEAHISSLSTTED